MNKRRRITQILSSLERTEEHLLDLSDDIWSSIDHNDLEELEAGYAFKREYNEAMVEFAEVAERIQGLISDFTEVQADEEATTADVEVDAAEHERVIRELDRTESHGLDEDFCHKRPYGFIFRGRAVKDLQTWRAVYERACRIVADQQGDEFLRVSTADECATSRGNRVFADSGEDMRTAYEVGPGVWAEMNLSANNIRDRIRELLEFFDYDWKEFRVYLREDRDAEDGVHSP